MTLTIETEAANCPNDWDTVAQALHDYLYLCSQHQYGGLGQQYQRARAAVEAMNRLRKRNEPQQPRL